MKTCTYVYPVAWSGKNHDTERENKKYSELLNKRLEEGFRIKQLTSSTIGDNTMVVFVYLEKE